MQVGGVTYEGAQNIFFAQLADPATTHFASSATRFFTGEFIVMIFGLPGAALAMYKTARKEKKKEVGGLLLSSALTSMLTGITEPIEFSFLFVAPLLFGVHAVLTGLAYMIAHVLNITVGLTFSGGFLDLFLFGILQGNSKTGWLMILPIGVIYFVIYYLVFHTLICKLKLKTPGRESDDEETKLYTKADYQKKKQQGNGAQMAGMSAEDEVSYKIMEGLGGMDNISDLDCCATRLRVTVKDMTLVNEAQLKATKAAGVVRKGNGVQVIYGPKVNIIKSNLEEFIGNIRSGKIDLSAVTGDADEADQIQQEEKVEPKNDKKTGKVIARTVIASPMDGMAADVSETPDEAFAGKLMGDGACVEPSTGMVYAPIDGTVGMIFDTKHAIGMMAEDGTELLIHVGIDTVKLGGHGFEPLVTMGDEVKKGTPLLKLDLEYLKGHAPSLVSPVVVTSLKDNQSVRMLKSGNVRAKEELMVIETYEA